MVLNEAEGKFLILVLLATN